MGITLLSELRTAITQYSVGGNGLITSILGNLDSELAMHATVTVRRGVIAYPRSAILNKRSRIRHDNELPSRETA